MGIKKTGRRVLTAVLLLFILLVVYEVLYRRVCLDIEKCNWPQRMHYLVFIKPYRTPGFHVALEDLVLANTSIKIITSSLPAPIYNPHSDLKVISTIDGIPPLIYQSYHSKRLIPPKVEKNFRTYASSYTRFIFNDTECITFLKTYFHTNVVRTYHQLEGPHRADLFRYAILYIHGGIYIDIKTELLKPLQDIFTIHGNTLTTVPTSSSTHSKNRNRITYTVLSPAKITGSTEARSCFQGVLGTPKGNPLFLRLIYHLVDATKPIIDYLITTKHIYELISEATGRRTLIGGLNHAKDNTTTSTFDYFLLEEKKREISECYDGPDRYGGCYYIFHGKDKVLKTRYADYPWEKQKTEPTMSAWLWKMLGW